MMEHDSGLQKLSIEEGSESLVSSKNTGVEKYTHGRTSLPSASQHGRILIKRAWKNELRNPKLAIGKILLAPVLVMLWTMSNFIEELTASNSPTVGGVQIFEGVKWDYPGKVYLAAENPDRLVQLEKIYSDLGVDSEVLDTIVNATEFSNYFADELQNGENSLNATAVFFPNIADDQLSYRLYTGAEVYSNIPLVLGTQRATDLSILSESGANPIESEYVQQTPELTKSQPSFYPVAGVSTLSIVFAMSLSGSIIAAPLIQDNANGILQSFLLVGVSLSTYTTTMALYISFVLGPIITLALFGVTWGWKLYDESNPIFVIISHFLFVIQYSTYIVQVSRLATSEARTQASTTVFILGGLFACAIFAPVIFVTDFTTFAPFSLLHPLFAVFSYGSIYGNAQGNGGVNGNNFVSSGLLLSMIFQILGIVVWYAALYVTSSPKLMKRLFSCKRSRTADEFDDTISNDSSRFEPLSNDADVVVRVKGLHKNFTRRFARKGTPKTNRVLRGLDMEVCRGEILGFLGHNGGGKTTTVNILTGALEATSGSVDYHFSDGTSESVMDGDIRRIRSLFGVCPQHNVDFGASTCREVLTLFALLKGGVNIPPGLSEADAIEAEVENLIKELSFDDERDADKAVSSFSGGMKRKVNIAVSLLGNPEAVFLDEPTAGMDPYNRRVVWDMILAAKKNRAIVLTTHFMDEADVLSDRVAIIKDGVLTTCGSTLFLKHYFGVGYRLKYKCGSDVDISRIINSAKLINSLDGVYEWTLPHGNEAIFSDAIGALELAGAADVRFGITTLEDVFLETGKEDYFGDTDSFISAGEGLSHDQLKKLWMKPYELKRPSFLAKVRVVTLFFIKDWLRNPGLIFVQLLQPFLYLTAVFLVVYLVRNPAPSTEDEIVIPISPKVLSESESRTFGLKSDLMPRLPQIDPIIPIEASNDVRDYFNGVQVSSGYIADNETLQFNASLGFMSSFIAEFVLATASLNNAPSLPDTAAINGTIIQLPLESDSGFRIDLFAMPLGLFFGFSAVGLSIFQVLLLKSTNVFGLLRTTGVSAILVYVSIMCSVLCCVVLPMTVLTVGFGLGFQNLIFGNGGRWLATLLSISMYAYAEFALVFLISGILVVDFKNAKNWIPSVYLMVFSLPYAGYALAISLISDENTVNVITIIGDVFCFIPVFGFQKSLSSILFVSAEYSDPDLSWHDTFVHGGRLAISLSVMFVSGTAYWSLLRYLSRRRPKRTKILSTDERVEPVDVSALVGIREERSRAFEEENDLTALDIVKSFRVPSKDSAFFSRRTHLKNAIGGVSFGLKKNEIFALIGPNGSGKTTLMSCLVGDVTPEHGEFSILGKRCLNNDPSAESLLSSMEVSYCPQFDALFVDKTVEEHLKFYAEIRGLDMKKQSTKEHIDVLVNMLGLTPHLGKRSKALSGGYKRRLSLVCALVGYTSVMLVDEVTTGLDPGARRLVWDTLKPSAVHDLDLPAILLSTHYMDEASILGSRIGIMIGGIMSATGTLESMQRERCQSFFLEISLQLCAPDSATDAIVDLFNSNGYETDVSERMPHRFKMQVPFLKDSPIAPIMQMGSLFQFMEKNKAAYHIRFYSISRATLEQIFIELSRDFLRKEALEAER